MLHSLSRSRAPITGLIRASFAASWPLQLALIAGGSLLLFISAKIKIPFWPVPATMQDLTVLLLALAFGARLGGGMVAFYLLQGIVGLPVFTDTPLKGIGLAYMAGPTGGYLLGFAVAAFILGNLSDRGYGQTVLQASLLLGLGFILIFAPGLTWMSVLFGWEKAILFGFTPFWAVTLAKLGLGTALMAGFCYALKMRN